MIHGNPRPWSSFPAEVWFAEGQLSAFKRERAWARAARIVLLVTIGRGRIAAAAEAPAAASPSVEREASLTVGAGIVAFSPSLDAEITTRPGVVLGIGGGGRASGPSVNAYLGYQIPLGEHWSLRPGFRAARSWLSIENCPQRCTFDFFIAETAVRYRSSSGFVFEYGLPLLAWAPVGPAAGETAPHLKLYTLGTGDTLLLGTVLFGYALKF